MAEPLQAYEEPVGPAPASSSKNQRLKQSLSQMREKLKAKVPHLHLKTSLKRSHHEPAHAGGEAGEEDDGLNTPQSSGRGGGGHRHHPHSGGHHSATRKKTLKPLKKSRLSSDMNDWGLTPDEESECLDQFVQELSDEPDVRYADVADKKKLLRFLKARNFNLDKAREMYLKHLKWREAWDVDNILFEEFPEREQLLQYFPQGYHMCDRQGRPIYIQYLGGINIHKILSFTDEETIVKLFIQEYEKFAHYKLPACSEAQGKLIETSLNIMDVKGISLKMLTKESQRIMKKVTGFTQDNYPEMMGNCIIINAPYIFKVIFNIVKPMLSARTQSKIKVVGTRYHETLLEYADASCLPERLGGTSKHTIFDDVGPWSELAPSITSKRQLDLYQSQQLSRWSTKPGLGVNRSLAQQVELSELHTIPSSQAFDSDDEGEDGGGSKGGETEYFTSRSSYGGKTPASASASGEERPSLLAWMAELEEEGERVFGARAVGNGTSGAPPASDSASLMRRLERLESRVASLLDVYPIVRPASEAQRQGEAISFRVRNQPGWLSVRVHVVDPAEEGEEEKGGGGSSVIGRMGLLEQRIRAIGLEGSGLSKGSARGLLGGSEQGLGKRSWMGSWLPQNAFTCCFGASDGLKRSLSGPEVI